MATSLVSLVQGNVWRILSKRPCICFQPVRFRRLRRHTGKYFEESKCLTDRVAELNRKDPVLDADINIGLPHKVESVDPHLRHKEWLRLRQGKEQAARKRELFIPIEDVKEKWEKEMGSNHVYRTAQHYGIYKDMFDSATFMPATFLHVTYDYDEEFVTPVRYGNKIPPAEAAVPPYVEYESERDNLYTLVMSSPDGHLEEGNLECLHWMVANIPGSDIDKGETICDYMRPFPPQGVGFLRYVFILYKQEGRVDLTDKKRSQKCMSLSERTFSTLEFYRALQDELTPAAVSFFQSRWDPSVRTFFRQELDMPEPKFQFIHPPPYHPKQKKYPHRESFNLYLDRYRDVKDINEEVLKERLKRISPFQENKPKPKYPSLVPFSNTMASWQKTRSKNIRLGRHQWKNIPGQ